MASLTGCQSSVGFVNFKHLNRMSPGLERLQQPLSLLLQFLLLIAKSMSWLHLGMILGLQAQRPCGNLNFQKFPAGEHFVQETSLRRSAKYY